MNVNGSEQTRLTSNSASDSMPIFSPDGKQIAFHSGRDGNIEIYRMKVSGSLRNMTNARIERSGKRKATLIVAVGCLLGL